MSSKAVDEGCRAFDGMFKNEADPCIIKTSTCAGAVIGGCATAPSGGWGCVPGAAGGCCIGSCVVSAKDSIWGHAPKKCCLDKCTIL